jgi:adenine-specific DNA-methyltransferase
LELLRDFLTQDGSIWISIDDDEGHYLKVICDEVFGRNNFINTVIWEKKYAPSNDAKWLSDSHDFILCYAKNKNIWRPNLLPRGEKQNKYYKYDGNDGRGLWRPDNVLVKTFSQSGVFGIKNPNTHKEYFPPQGSCYRFNEETAKKYLAENRFYFGKDGKGAPQLKRFLSEVKQGVTSLTIWKRDEVGDNQEAKFEVRQINGVDAFSTPKPEKLLERILILATNKGDLVLDSFLGSGTTAAVAHKMGRKYIGIEMREQAKTHCAERLKKVIDGEQGGISKSQKWKGGGGFRFYTLGEAIFDSDGKINDQISFENLAAHIWFSETKTPYNKTAEKSTFLGLHNGTAYALLYNDVVHDRSISAENTLTSKTLQIIENNLQSAEYDKLVIYGECCRISENRLKEKHIEFKQTPYDVKHN